MMLYCCECKVKVEAKLTSGEVVYPHRPDLYSLPFWRCEICKNYVGCHHKTKNRTAPLGNIPNPEMRKARKEIHKILDPLWKSGKYNRGALYEKISNALGWNYHTAMIRTIDEARQVFKLVKKLSNEAA